MSAAKPTPDKAELDLAYDAAIEPVIEALQNFVRIHQALFPDMLSINRERFVACWIAGILSAVGLDLERAVESLHDDDLTLHDDPNIEINDIINREFRRSTDSSAAQAREPRRP